jgi:hypothetical protein
VRVELTTCGLRNRCSTTELLQRERTMALMLRESTSNLRKGWPEIKQNA